jgi:hypothetical protein
MTLITKRRGLRLLALAKPHFFRFIEYHFNAAIGSFFYVSMSIVAKRLLFTEAAGTPGIYFAWFYYNACRFTMCDAGEAFVGYRFFHGFYFFSTQRYSGTELHRGFSLCNSVSPSLCVEILISQQ